MGASSSRESPVEEGVRTRGLQRDVIFQFVSFFFWQDCAECHSANATDADADAAGPAPTQVVSAAPAEAAPNPTHEVAPTQEAGIKDEDQWWYQGPRFCLKCKTKSYLRQNICFNMNCVPWINVV